MTRKKLIEVALPLEAINEAASREKSIRHGHPSTLHLWWARRPLAACRAVLFGQLVDDPSSVPEEFPDEAAQEEERRRLFDVIEDLVKWENSTNEQVVYAARREIARSVARARGEAPPETNGELDAYLAEKAPPVLDPFCGGGSIPLEAQRLGLRAYASDLNPVAVLITKALIEIPPKFAGLPPVNPEAREKLAGGGRWNGRGAQGLAEDVRYYGRWMRDEAARRIGHLYPKAKLPDGQEAGSAGGATGKEREATVIAWIWARTVASPNPAANGAHVPLVSSFVLSSKQGKEAIVVPVVDAAANTYRFEVKTKGVDASELAEAKKGTKAGKAQDFICLFTNTPIKRSYIQAEGKADRLGVRLMAVVAEGKRGRAYVEPASQMEEAARNAVDYSIVQEARETFLSGSTPTRAMITGGVCSAYGLRTWGHLFTPRQLVALTTFSDLVGEAREKALADARAAGLSDDKVALNEAGTGAGAYADAVATYLGLTVGRQANRLSSICFWDTGGQKVQQVFARQAIPMTWDHVEGNPFSTSSGNWLGQLEFPAKSIEMAPATAQQGHAKQLDAATAINGVDNPAICTDPPYYDNIGYADLADFFYVWLRRALGETYPNLFRTLLTPKAAELVATPYRFSGNKEKAREFFREGLGKAISQMRSANLSSFPMTIIYAFKQAETESDRDGNGATASTGWETMLDGIIQGAFSITGTWPMRTELSTNLKKNVAALASSITLGCRPRPENAEIIARRDFVNALKRELPPAVRRLQKENIAPVDLAQAAIGPGMAVFSRYGRVLEADGSPMPVRAALIEINRVLDEVLAEQEGEMDGDTRFCVAWYEQYGTGERPYGEAEVLLTAKNTSFAGLEKAGVIAGGRGKARLKRRDELDPHWHPETDARITDWECAQHLVRAMTAEHGGGAREAARLVAAMGPGRAANARALAYRLYTAAERRRWSDEALAYNILVTSWPQIQAEAMRLAAGGPAQSELAV